MPRGIEDPGWQQLQAKVHEAISQFASDFGARECQHGDWGKCEENDGEGCPFDETRSKPGSMPMIQHWVLLVATPDVADGPAGIDETLITPPQQPGYVTNGLLLDGIMG